MSSPRHCLSWDETIRPAKHTALYTNIDSLSLSPDNKRKRRLDEAAPGPLPGTVHKRARQARVHTPRVGLKRRLEALEKQQLATLLERLLERQPELVPLVDQMTPQLKVAQALEQLRRYHSNILDSLPLGTPSNDYAFLRVRSLWTNFFVALADYTVLFVYSDGETQQALEFLDAATALVHEAPRWDSHANNALLATAYTELSQAWITTLERAGQSASFAYLTGEMWETKFNEHCARSKSQMADTRMKEPSVEIPRACQTVTS